MRSTDTETLTSDDITRSKKFTEGTKMKIITIALFINTYSIVITGFILPDFTFVTFDRNPVFRFYQSFPDEPLKYAGSE